MLKRLLIVPILFFPIFLFAQGTLISDDASRTIIERECNDKLFIKVEQLPSLKIAKEAFEDTLVSELKSRNFSLINSKITYTFLVTSKSEILNISIESGDISKEKILRQTLSQLSSLWAPAQQNGRIVCAYVRLKMDFNDSKLHIDIMQ